MESAQYFEDNGGYDVGDFGDARLKKAAQFSSSAWCANKASVCDDWREAGHERFNSDAGWRMIT